MFINQLRVRPLITMTGLCLLGSLEHFRNSVQYKFNFPVLDKLYTFVVPEDFTPWNITVRKMNY